MENEKKEEKVYTPIDIDALSSYLAEDSLRVRTKDVPEEDLYPVELNKDSEGMRVEKEMASRWVTLLFNLKQTWAEFLYTFSKSTEDEENK